MKTCPTCNAKVAVLIVNLKNGQRFCHHCAGIVYPSSLPKLVFTQDDVGMLRAIGVDPEVGKIEDHLKGVTEHCKRPSGTERAWFRTRKEAEAFAADPANPAYLGDLPALCARCNFYHLNRPEWLEPMLTHQDAHLLERMGIEAPAKVPGDLKCANCHVEFRTGIDFLILPDGKMICGTECAAR
jgi:hypothetical protein